MGTRHLTCVFEGNEFKVAQYGQWDGYPKGQGVTVLNFLKTCDINRFKRNVRKCFFGNEEQLKAAYSKFSTDGWMTMEQADAFKKSEFGHMSRDVGADILKLIEQSDDGLMLEDDHKFGYNGLSCEWAYVINLNTLTLDCYKGFGKEIPKAGLWMKDQPDEYGYYPIDLVKSYSLLDELPDEKTFISDLNPPSEEE